METIRSDFDRLAVLENKTGGWSHNDHYHAYLLRYIPHPCNESLEIGCGTGAFTRLLAGRSRHVLGLDLSPEMIRIACNFMNLTKDHHLRPSRSQRLAWAEHGKHDHYLKVSEVRRICRDILPGVIIRKHLFWRYSLEALRESP